MVRYRGVLLVLAGTALLNGCDSTPGESQFVAFCQKEGGSQARCACDYRTWKEALPPDVFGALIRSVVNNDKAAASALAQKHTQLLQNAGWRVDTECRKYGR